MAHDLEAPQPVISYHDGCWMIRFPVSRLIFGLNPPALWS